jgi:hypothetical protein
VDELAACIASYLFGIVICLIAMACCSAPPDEDGL